MEQVARLPGLRANGSYDTGRNKISGAVGLKGSHENLNMGCYIPSSTWSITMMGSLLTFAQSPSMVHSLGLLDLVSWFSLHFCSIDLDGSFPSEVDLNRRTLYLLYLHLDSSESHESSIGSME